MNTTESRIVQMLTGKNNLSEVNVEELNEIAVQQPYNSVVQLLITKKMKEENHPSFHQQIHKASLYFPDSHWLHFQLYHADSLAPSEEINAFSGYTTDGNNVSDYVETTASSTDVLDEVLIEEVTPSQPENPNESEEELPDHDTEEAQGNDEVDAGPGGEAHEAAAGNISRLLSEQAKMFQQPVEEQSDILIENEPYHTVDYFASQGIELDSGLPAQDQLESKMRKFTDWLKQMKRGNKTKQPLDLGTPPELEHAARNIAESSNTPKEVATEAMADVLIKQGKMEKAIEVYLKLSFLNPEKSAYFASKIQELKGI